MKNFLQVGQQLLKGGDRTVAMLQHVAVDLDEPVLHMSLSVLLRCRRRDPANLPLGGMLTPAIDHGRLQAEEPAVRRISPLDAGQHDLRTVLERDDFGDWNTLVPFDGFFSGLPIVGSRLGVLEKEALPQSFCDRRGRAKVGVGRDTRSRKQRGVGVMCRIHQCRHALARITVAIAAVALGIVS